jgi:hypothetical protein
MTRNRYRPRRIIVGTLVSLLLLQAAFYFVVPWWHPDTEYRIKKEALQARLAERPDHSPLVMVGSSRVSFAFDPELLQPLTDESGKPVLSFNFGHFNAGPTSHLLTVDRLVRSGVKPRWLIVEVLPALCFEEWAGFVHSSRWDDIRILSKYYPFDKYGGALLKNHLLLPWYFYRGELQEHYLHERQAERMALKTSPYGCLTHIAECIDAKGRQQSTESQCRVFGADLSGSMRLTSSSEAAYRELLQLCGREGIEAALIMMPEGDTFRSWYSDAANLELTGFLDRLSAEFAVPIFDARQWFGDEYFADSHHLLRPGACEFTRRFEREILQPFVHGQVPAESLRFGNTTARRP